MHDDTSAVIEALAPEGKLRVAINYGNVVLAQRGEDGEPAGVSAALDLTRALQHASLERAATSAAAIDLFVESQLDAAAGVRQPLECYAGDHPGYRVLPDRFTAIEQCMAIPKAHAAAADYVEDFLARMKREGLVKQALAESG